MSGQGLGLGGSRGHLGGRRPRLTDDLCGEGVAVRRQGNRRGLSQTHVRSNPKGPRACGTRERKCAAGAAVAPSSHCPHGNPPPGPLQQQGFTWLPLASPSAGQSVHVLSPSVGTIVRGQFHLWLDTPAQGIQPLRSPLLRLPTTTRKDTRQGSSTVWAAWVRRCAPTPEAPRYYERPRHGSSTVWRPRARHSAPSPRLHHAEMWGSVLTHRVRLCVLPAT